MGMKRVTNDRAKYLLRSKVGLKLDIKDTRVKTSARRKFEATPDGYFVWARDKRDVT